MLAGPSGSKRKATASEIDVPAKRSTHVVVPEEVAALLRTMASSPNAATLDLMALPCTDIAARGRVVAIMAKCKHQLNKVLGIKQRSASVLAASDLVIEVFFFVRRKDLDTLQIVSRRFNAIVVQKMARVSLRHLWSAKMQRSNADQQFVLLMDEVGARKKTRLLTGVNNAADAATILLNACQSSRLGSLELNGRTPDMNLAFFDSLELRAPTIFLKELSMGNRTLSDGVPHNTVIRVLQTFAELKTVSAQNIHVQSCLLRTCFKAGVDFANSYIWQRNTSIIEDGLLEYCFGACDEQYATRERCLQLEFTDLKNNFLQRWIERAEVHDCRHRLTLRISAWQPQHSQNTGALDAYKHNDQNNGELLFGSVSGRRWTVTYKRNHREDITFKINRQ